MNDRYDVVIIGAGPAGSMLAAQLASKAEHLTLALIDGNSKEKPKVCGGLLSPNAQKVFSRLGITLPTQILSDPQIFDVATIDLCTGLKRNYQRHYLNMDRYAFDRWLVSRVPEAVDIFEAHCMNITQNGDSFLIELLTADGTKTITANNIVGADGANSIVRRTFFDKKIKKYVAIQQHFECNNASLPPYSCIFDPVTSKSCSWTILKNDTAIFGGAFDKKNCREAFEKQKNRFEEFTGVKLGTPIRTEACLVTSPQKMSDFVLGKDNIFLVGEAAGFISASSFEGIGNAILSAKLLADSFAKSNQPKEIQKAYRKATVRLRSKLLGKIFKKHVLCSPFLRLLIMKSGIKSIKKFV